MLFKYGKIMSICISCQNKVFIFMWNPNSKYIVSNHFLLSKRKIGNSLIRIYLAVIDCMRVQNLSMCHVSGQHNFLTNLRVFFYNEIYCVRSLWNLLGSYIKIFTTSTLFLENIFIERYKKSRYVQQKFVNETRLSKNMIYQQNLIIIHTHSWRNDLKYRLWIRYIAIGNYIF